MLMKFRKLQIKLKKEDNSLYQEQEKLNYEIGFIKSEVKIHKYLPISEAVVALVEYKERASILDDNIDRFA